MELEITETQRTDFDAVYGFLMEKLEKNLPSYLEYHDVEHTRSVIETTERIARAEEMNDEEILLLRTAALFHDSGFLKRYVDHEEASCVIAMDILPKYGYSEAQIKKICRLIMATKLPQQPHDKLEQVICDADLHYLGTDTYFQTAECLYREFKNQGLVKNRKDWKKQQVQFLGAHHYFTQTGIQNYAVRKGENLRLVSEGKIKIRTEEEFAEILKDVFLILLGVITAGFALKGFLVPNNFFDGGVTGLSLLVHELYHVNLAYAIMLINLPLVAVSYFTVSKQFAVKTFVCIALLAVCLFFLHYPVITSDKLLISIFGGFFLGLGIGLTMRAGCALDGLEVLALYTWKRTSFTITEIIMALNIVIFTIAAFKFGIETALYSILTYFAASKTIDYVVEGIEEYTGVTIISGQSELVKHRLVNELGRGITVYKGERGFLPGKFKVSYEADIIFTVVTRLEMRKLKNVVYSVDPKAFVFANSIKEASGGIIKRRHVH
jgi:uncharacterized membrane-anchored protein YitT (DUF2179 family)/predicted house-cleaning noncanonical NTP pyrophosphatase (MazG superfamily)